MATSFITRADVFDLEVPFDRRQASAEWREAISPDNLPLLTLNVKYILNRYRSYGYDTRGLITSRLCAHALQGVPKVWNRFHSILMHFKFVCKKTTNN
jgi:hypothetical protein